METDKEKHDYGPGLAAVNSQASVMNKGKHTDCEIQNSSFYEVIRFPLIFLNIACINVPDVCICGVNSTTRRRDVWSTELHQSVNTFTGNNQTEQDQTLSVYGKCRNSDGLLWSLIKKCLLVILLGYQIADTVRNGWIVVRATQKINMVVFCLATTLCLLLHLFLRVLNSFACRRHLKPFLSAAFAYEKQYGFSFDVKKLTQTGKIVFLVVICYQILLSASVAFGGFYFTPEALSIQMWPFSFTEGLSRHVYCIVYSVIAFFSSSIVLAAYFFEIFIVMVLRGEFQTVENEMRNALADLDDNPSSGKKFDLIVNKFRALSDLQDKGYGVVKHKIAAVYGFGLAKVCLTMYGLVSGSINLDQYVMLTWNAIDALVFLTHTTVMLARLQSQARAVADVVYGASWDVFPQQLLHKATLFTAMFNNKSFGMSVYGMFVVDWSTLLMVGGTLLTYGVVIIQFQIGAPEPVCHCA